MQLLVKPKEPASTALYIFSRHVRNNGEWEPFLKGW
jgi:hypothetical protein